MEHDQRPGAGHRLLGGAPGGGLARRVQRLEERGDVGQAQPPRRQLRRGRHAGPHGDRGDPHVGEPGAGGLVTEPGRIRPGRPALPLHRLVPGGGLVAERAERLVHGQLGRVGPAGRERAGGQAVADAPDLTQGIAGTVQVVQAERGHDEIERPVAERQRRGVGRHRMLRRAGEAEHGHGQVGGHDPVRARGQRGPPGHAGSRAQVEHPAAGHRDRRGQDQGPGQRRVHPLRAGRPRPGGRFVGGAQVRGHPSRGAACTAFASHQASSSS